MLMSKKRKAKIISVIGISAVLLAALVFLGLFLFNEYSLTVELNGASELTVEYGEAFTDPGAVGFYSGTIFQRKPIDIPVSTEGRVDVQTVGDYELHYRAEHKGVSGFAVRKVHVVDTVKPEITLTGEAEITLPVQTAYEEPGYTAVDNYSGDLTDLVTVTGELNPEVPGVYTLIYAVSDSSGNRTSVQRTITYVDETAPVIELTDGALIEVEPGNAFADPGFTAYDNCDGDISTNVTVEGTVDPSTPGTYTLVYTVSDKAGNITQIQRTVIVKDLTPPEIILSGDAVVSFTVGSAYQEPGFTATDDIDGDLTDQVEVTSNVQLYTPGTYTVTYTVSDSSGNTTTVTRTVVMSDITPQVTGGIIYLTYDDGPSGYTSKLLDVLDKYGVKVTFFVVNTGYGDTMARAAAAGHTIAIHSSSHDYNRIYASEEAYFNDLYYMQSVIESYTGQTPMMLRFPGGSSNTVSRFNPGIMTRLTQAVQEQGFRYFDWNVDSRDAGGITNGYMEAADNVIRGIRGRKTSVVLMHDSQGTCIRATERIIEWGLANGYTFAALTYNGPGCHHGVNN